MSDTSNEEVVETETAPPKAKTKAKAKMPGKGDFLIQPCGKPDCGAVFVKNSKGVRPATAEEIDHAGNYYAGFAKTRKQAKRNNAY